VKLDWLAWTGRGGGPDTPTGPSPSLPVENLYYLLCYAANRLEARDLIDIDSLDGASPADLFTEILVAGLHRLRKRGSPRLYRTHTEDSSAPRGRIELSPTIARGLLPSGRVQCSIDELTADIATNRALKAACRILASKKEVTEERRRALRGHTVALGSVGDVPLTWELLTDAAREKHDGLTDLLISVCWLVQRAGLPRATGTGHPFLDLGADPSTFGHLFEAFVLGWLCLEQHTFGARKAQVPWLVEASATDLAMLPSMEGDILLSDATARYLIECKAYGQTLSSHRGSAKVRSNHIYQLHTYLAHLSRDGGPPVTGILLYARAEADLDLRWHLGDHDIWVRTLDLGRPWQEIDRALRGLVERCAGG